MSDHEVRTHHDPSEGFDRDDPKARLIFAIGAGSIVLLLLTILAVQIYYEKIYQEAVYEKVLAPPSEQLLELHSREDWNLTHYGYTDLQKSHVRIPVDRAMELFSQEAAAGKLFYPAKPTVPKKEEPEQPAPGAAPAAVNAPEATNEHK